MATHDSKKKMASNLKSDSYRLDLDNVDKERHNQKLK